MNDYRHTIENETYIVKERNRDLVSENKNLIEELENTENMCEARRRTCNELLEEAIFQDEEIHDLRDEKDKLEDNHKYDCEYLRNWIDDLLVENEKLTKKIESRNNRMAEIHHTLGIRSRK